MATDHDWDADRALFVAGHPAPDVLDAEAGPLAREFVALAESLAAADTVQGVLVRVVDAARQVVPGADLVSVTVRLPEGRFHTPARTDPLATRLDDVQYRFAEGPCVQATLMSGGAVAVSDDLGHDGQYPNFGPAAAAEGVHSVLATGLFPRGEEGGDGSGALNVYSFRPGGLTGVDRDIALVLAAHAATALAATEAVTAAELEVAQLRTALRSRDVIGQAKGILMQRRGISADEAFDTLRRASQSLNVKLAHLAETVVAQRVEL